MTSQPHLQHQTSQQQQPHLQPSPQQPLLQQQPTPQPQQTRSSSLMQQQQQQQQPTPQQQLPPSQSPLMSAQGPVQSQVTAQSQVQSLSPSGLPPVSHLAGQVQHMNQASWRGQNTLSYTQDLIADNPSSFWETSKSCQTFRFRVSRSSPPLRIGAPSPILNWTHRWAKRSKSLRI
ncbi:UNVERIFIED_CONTAM: hypothetical protein GTU68_034308, partial [Idotea baltica]|nr:hypothetical protein [Idotea baltica]